MARNRFPQEAKDGNEGGKPGVGGERGGGNSPNAWGVVITVSALFMAYAGYCFVRQTPAL